MTTYGATSDDKVVKVTIFCFQWSMWCHQAIISPNWLEQLCWKHQEIIHPHRFGVKIQWNISYLKVPMRLRIKFSIVNFTLNLHIPGNENTILVLLCFWRTTESWSCHGHYNDIIMGAIASQITSLPIVYSKALIKGTSKLRVTGLYVGNSPLTGEFPTQKTSNAENASIWWRHHGDFRVNLSHAENCIIQEN